MIHNSKSSLKVCIDARIISGLDGGVEQVVIGLASGLSKLTDSDDQYYFLTIPGHHEWLSPYTKGPCSIIQSNAATRIPKYIFNSRVLKSIIDKAKKYWPFYETLATSGFIPRSDGFLETLGMDIIHFATQSAFITDLPSIYQPHDLLHLHFASQFDHEIVRKREIQYRYFCGQASMIAIMSEYGKQDLINKYHLPSDKIQVIPWASFLSECPTPTWHETENVKLKYVLPERFIFYPAQTWEHKNHINLLNALFILREKYKLTVNLVCTGRLNDFHRKIMIKVSELNLDEQVKFLGFISQSELLSVYQLCDMLVFPSLFEGWGMPVMEAFSIKVPVACSEIHPLLDQAEGAAMMFDPNDPQDIAIKIHRVYTNKNMQNELISKGIARVHDYSWHKTAKLFRAHYRRILNRQLTEEDKMLLSV